ASVGECAGLVNRNKTVAFDWTRGYVAEMSADGIAATEIVRTLYVASLGMYIRGGCKLTIMNFAHEKIHRFMPVVSDSGPPMWVRTHNGYNDSRQKKVKPVPVEPLTPEQEAEFRARFAVDADTIRRSFGR
ncbi:glycosyltransferase, partial [Cribrihabitans sp. XS_ASV171]